MEIGKTIRNLREEAGLSQEQLASKVFVSRQTISNWENDKSYPDVQSLAMIAELFGTSIDSLVRGDLPMIETKIAKADMRSLRRNAGLYGALLVVSLVVSVVAFAQENWLAFTTAALMYALSLYFAFAFDRDKRKYDVQTYREVRALCNGASLEEIKAQRVPEQAGASVMRKVVVGGCSGVVVAVVTIWLVRLFS